MHIPDGFLATPVWITLDAIALPAVAGIARRAQRGFEEAQAPLLGVMGAFIFAAQLINFPVGGGTSGHLLGGALLAFTLGPAAASVVMTAILGIQALVFQDGGLLALGANVINMAILGVWAAYLPYHFAGSGRWRRYSIFAGAALSVLVSGSFALSELLISGVKIPVSALGLSLAVFLVSAVLEGAITLTVLESLERFRPKLVRLSAPQAAPARAAMAVTAVLLASVGVLFASQAPDAIQHLTTHSMDVGSGWVPKAGAGLAGLALIYAACLAIGRIGSRQRSV